MSDHISINTVRREAEEIRSAMIANVTQNLFRRLMRPISNLHGLISRAQTMEQAIAFDDDWLAEFGTRRANIPAYVAGQVNPVHKIVAKHRENTELREAA